jgi:hypothetical protein
MAFGCSILPRQTTLQTWLPLVPLMCMKYLGSVENRPHSLD